MVGKLRDVWAKWRESSRQHAIDRTLYKAGDGRGPRDGGPATPGGRDDHGDGAAGRAFAGARRRRWCHGRLSRRAEPPALDPSRAASVPRQRAAHDRIGQ